MSDDEIFILLAAGVIAGLAAFSWYGRVATPSLAGYPGRWRSWLGLAPAAAIAGIFIVLTTIAAQDVRTAPQYIVLYLLLGAAWIFVAIRLTAMLGVSYRDDALERRNPAAAIAVICALLAHAAIYSGANVGDGPGWWCVVTAGLVGVVPWVALWSLIEYLCHASELITVDRDVPAAIRFGGYMVASALICARGIAGDWVSMADTIAEFRDAWPVALLCAVTIGVEFGLRDRAERKSVPFAIVIAAAYVVLAILAIATSPPLSSNPLFPPPAAPVQ